MESKIQNVFVAVKEKILATVAFLSAHQAFAKLMSSCFVSYIGDYIHTVANMILIQQMTGSAAAMGGVFIANTVPRIIFSLIGGVSVDRYDKRLILVICDIVRAVGVFIIVIMSLTGHLQVWYVVLFSALNGAAQSFSGPAVSAAIPVMIKDKSQLQVANALNSLSIRIAGILGSAVGGILIATAGLWIGYFIDGLSYVFSALIIFGIVFPPASFERVVDTTSQGITGVLREFKEGLRFIYSNAALLSIVTMSVSVSIVSIPVAQLLPSFVQNAFSAVDSEKIGYLWSGMTLGLLLGALSLSYIVVKDQTSGIFMSVAIFGGTAIVFGFSSSFLLAFIGITTLGFFLSWAIILPTTLYQILVPEQMLGRFFGNLGLLTLGIQPLIMWSAGIAADSYGPGRVITGMGCMLVIFCAFTALRYQFLRTAINQQKTEIEKP